MTRATNPAHQPITDAKVARQDLLEEYIRIRHATEQRCAPLQTEDFIVQTMPDVSPTKWHLAHTSWFFEEFVLSNTSHKPFNDTFSFLFNSYYNTIGPQFPRPSRGHLSRPTVSEIFTYRKYIDECMTELLTNANNITPDLHEIIVIGLNHEQQHQELILTDIKHVFGSNPLRPAYVNKKPDTSPPPARAHWIAFQPSLKWIGHDGHSFCYDNEMPRHQQYVEPFEICSQLVTNQEYAAFIDDNGYQRPELWLSDGWNACKEGRWNAPLYWDRIDDQWHEMTLSGLQPTDPNNPVCHVSYYEADAFARWSQAWLPTEAAWETSAEGVDVSGNFVENDRLHPQGAAADGARNKSLQQMFGDVWEWTCSPYTNYPGFRSPQGALGEYNGKFMSNQIVLRGGSCVTAQSHMRATYRNFLPPDARWQFSGIRLSREVR